MSFTTAFRLTSALYDARDGIRTILGPRYRPQIDEMIVAVKNVADGKGIDLMAAAIELAKAAGDNAPISRGLCFAAMVEIYEAEEFEAKAHAVGELTDKVLSR